jgi:Dockerin type I domain
MKRESLCYVVVVMCLLVGAGHAESLNFAQSVKYASPHYGNEPISQGLYVRGCGIYTCNDWGGVGLGIFNASLRHTSSSTYSSQPGSIVSVGVDTSHAILGFRQRTLVEDWFGTGVSAISSYHFTSVGMPAGLPGSGLLTSKIRDYSDCTVFEKTDTTMYNGIFHGSITTYMDTIYVSGYGGLHVLDLDTANASTSLLSSSAGRFGLGATRISNRIYEAAKTNSVDGASPDTVTIFIRNASNLSSVASLVLTGLHANGEPGTDGGFKVVKDSFFISGQKRVRTIGALSYMNDLFLFDLSNDSIHILYESRTASPNPFSTRPFCDIAVLDRRLFALSVGECIPTHSTSCPWLTEDFLISVLDISTPSTPVLLTSLSTIDAAIRGDDGMDTVKARKDSSNNPIQDIVFHVDNRNRIQVVRNRYSNPVNPTGFWDTDGSYSIFCNMQATTERFQTESGGGFPFVHQVVYTPSTSDNFRIGNVNGSSGASINIVDVTTLVNYLNDATNTVAVHKPASRYDVNLDGYINWADLRALRWYLFQSGQKPGRICKNCL